MYLINRPRIFKIIRELFIFALIILIIISFRSSFFEPYKIPTGSMIPTLMIGDYIIVNKYAYGFKLPLSEYWGTPIYLSERKKPARGDVIVFKFPLDEKLNYVKRVIGLPGEMIEIKNKKIYINDRLLNEMPTNSHSALYKDILFENYNFLFKRVVSEGHKYIVQYDSDNFFQSDIAKVIIPDNHYFVIGDNRDFSYDSRFWGFVPLDNIKGRAEIIWLSMSLFPKKGSPTFRSERIGLDIL